jgi:hypothetical protein
MRKGFLVAAALLTAMLVPTSAFAWGAAAHRYIMRRAIDLLPPEIKPFFEHNRDELVIRANDPAVARWSRRTAESQIDFGVDDYGHPFAAAAHRRCRGEIRRRTVVTVCRGGR